MQLLAGLLLLAKLLLILGLLLENCCRHCNYCFLAAIAAVLLVDMQMLLACF
jgi:hypothetical protein